jgi:hypothetical protein
LSDDARYAKRRYRVSEPTPQNGALSAETVAAIRRLCRFAVLLADAAEDLEALLPASPSGPRTGRPAVVPSREQELEVLRLRHANGRLGLRSIGKRVGLSWRSVQRILDENVASQNRWVRPKTLPAATPPSEHWSVAWEGGETQKAATEI